MDFFNQPILNSPYKCPTKHWELNDEGQPTENTKKTRRPSSLITPVPKLRRKARTGDHNVTEDMVLDTGDGLSTTEQEYNISDYINEIRMLVDQWRNLPERDWGVTVETAQLLRYWRSHKFEIKTPFFCQIEAVETAIWLAEVATKKDKRALNILQWLKIANDQAHPKLFRLAFKLATGTGKTTVMAMLIAWQTVNAVRHPQMKSFSRAFLIVTPGITVKDRLRVLQPNDPESYYKTRELIPVDMQRDIEKAKIVITNYHAFKKRDTFPISKKGRDLLNGRSKAICTDETEWQMLRRVMGGLMSMKNVVVINDEAHHCYREKSTPDTGTVIEEERNEVEKNMEAARIWITGIEIVKRRLGVRVVYDLSATPFFLTGSGYAEGTLFPWVVSDFALMDAIECGIVKLPRIPVSDNVARDEMPIYRNLWNHIGKEMHKKGKGRKNADPQDLPVKLQTALAMLYGHYKKTYHIWQDADIPVPPVYIIVCNNTAASKLIYDYISGYERANENGDTTFYKGCLGLFQNFDKGGQRLSIPRTLLIDSTQLESGDALDKEFRKAAAPEIERFRSERLARTGNLEEAEKIDDATLLREAMNTVGQANTLGGQIRCVVSVSMLTEGWDVNTVTHVLGVRAFSTQLICEQVVGRALRRQSYDLNEDKVFDVEYADVLGIPFDFAVEPVVVRPKPPRETIRVWAMCERDNLEILFPKVEGYRIELPNSRLTAKFTDDHTLRLTPDWFGPSHVVMQGIVGEGNTLKLNDTEHTRKNTILYEMARHLLYHKYRDPNGEPKLHLFGQLKSICRYWVDNHLQCIGSTSLGLLVYKEILDKAANKIAAAIIETHSNERLVKATIDPYNMSGSSSYVNFTTSNPRRLKTSKHKCHVNYVIGDSNWELNMAEALEASPRVLAYIKNYSLGFEVPYLLGSEPHKYQPDFILKVDDGIVGDPLNLIVEVKGYRGEAAAEKANAMKAFWVPGVNNLIKFGRWDFVEFRGDVFDSKTSLQEAVDAQLSKFANANDKNDTP